MNTILNRVNNDHPPHKWERQPCALLKFSPASIILLEQTQEFAMKKVTTPKYHLHLSFIIILLTVEVLPQTTPFFRMTDQDKEKYIYTEGSWEYGSSSETGSFLETRVDSVKDFGGIRFFKGYAVNTGLYFGMDEQNNKLYYLTNDTVMNMLFDFNIPPGGNYSGRFPDANTSSPHNIVVTGTDSVRYFDYYWSFAPFSLNITYRVEKGLGLRWHYYSYSISNGRGFSYKHATYNLIRYDAAGDTIYKTQNWAPKISFSPLQVTNKFQLLFLPGTSHDVHDYYGDIVANLNFNDSLFMQGYYTNGTDSTLLQTWRVEAETPQTAVSFFLDSTKMKSGYRFKYRFALRDKFYRPKLAYSPSETGFHSIVYNPSVGIEDEVPPVPGKIDLASFPNPVSQGELKGIGVSKIRYNLPVTGYTKGVIYDLLGREVAVLIDQEKSAGEHTVDFNTNGLPSGVYIFRLISGNNNSTLKIMLSK